jgi:hypothetical protein
MRSTFLTVQNNFPTAKQMMTMHEILTVGMHAQHHRMHNNLLACTMCGYVYESQNSCIDAGTFFLDSPQLGLTRTLNEKMMFFTPLVYVSGYLCLLFMAVCMACGLYYLAEVRKFQQVLPVVCLPVCAVFWDSLHSL